MPIQYAVPVSDISRGTWVQNAGNGNAFAWDELDDGIDSGVPDNQTTSWRTANNPSNATIRVALTPLAASDFSQRHILKIRVAKGASAGRRIDITGRLFSGSTLITERTAANISNVWQTLSMELTEAEAEALTDYSNIQVEIVANAVGTGLNRQMLLSAIEFQCPKEAVEPHRSLTAVAAGRFDEAEHAWSNTARASAGEVAARGRVCTNCKRVEVQMISSLELASYVEGPDEPDHVHDIRSLTRTVVGNEITIYYCAICLQIGINITPRS
jgi:hypothetical protein